MKNTCLLIAITLVAINFAQQTLADIGAIGSPVVPSNLPPQPKKKYGETAAAKSDQKQEAVPVLVINFNQRHVYYDRQLQQALSRSELNQAGALYDVVSLIPNGNAGKTEVENLNDMYDTNLNEVVSYMQNAGIPSSRIHVSTTNSDEVTAQQISIYVK